MPENIKCAARKTCGVNVIYYAPISVPGLKDSQLEKQPATSI